MIPFDWMIVVMGRKVDYQYNELNGTIGYDSLSFSKTETQHQIISPHTTMLQ